MQTRRLTILPLLTLCFALLGTPTPAAAKTKWRADATGIKWVFPFKQAQARARAKQRLLFIRPLPFGTDETGGWDPVSEVMRAGPLSDERVAALVNRRFIAHYFDLSPRGIASDQPARDFVTASRFRLTRDSVGAPPVLLMTHDGKVLDEIGNYASADEMLEALVGVLRAHPEFAKPGADEKQHGTRLSQARIAMELQDLDRALKLIKNRNKPEERLLRVKIHRWRGDFEAVAKELPRVRKKSLANEVKVERAHLLWHQGDMETMQKTLEGLSVLHPRYTEARYLEGLAWYHTGDWDKALDIWSRTIRTAREDRWIYRADWAFTQVKQGEDTTSLSQEKSPRVSVLGRIGYLAPKGKTHPHLESR